MESLIPLVESLGFTMPEGYTLVESSPYEMRLMHGDFRVGVIQHFEDNGLYECRVRGMFMDEFKTLPEAVRFLFRDQCDTEV